MMVKSSECDSHLAKCTSLVRKCSPECGLVVAFRVVSGFLARCVEDNPRVILHFDMDCFYAQVEMIRNPGLRSKPVGEFRNVSGHTADRHTSGSRGNRVWV